MRVYRPRVLSWEPIDLHSLAMPRVYLLVLTLIPLGLTASVVMEHVAGVVVPRLLVFGGAAVAFVIIGFTVWPPRLNRAIARVMAAGGRCGSCGYPLSGLPVEADGAAVCPECGAAWIVPTKSERPPR